MIDIEEPDELIRYLRDSGRVTAHDPRIEKLAGGVSCRTVMVELDSGECWVLKQALEKLRVDVDWFSDPNRIHQEALGMRWLARLTPPGFVPTLVFEDEDQHLVAMEAVPRPHARWKDLLLDGEIEPDYVDQFGRMLGTIHRTAEDHQAELAAQFYERSFFETLRLEPYYAFSAEQVPKAAPFLHHLIDETRATRQTLVHGDYSPKNILIHDGKLVLLDHEVIHWGDGAFDLGFAMAHFLSKAHHLPVHRRAFAAAARRFWRTYRREVDACPWTEQIEPRAVRHTLGCVLARAVGRSKLEYLSREERERQAQAAMTVMLDPPPSIAALVATFLPELEKRGS